MTTLLAVLLAAQAAGAPFPVPGCSVPGWTAHGAARSFDPETLSPDEKALLERPIADLNLSVRARKCMVRLGISTIGELLRRTGDDLLECKNFGVTSLNEVREKLTLQSLKLRGD